MADGSLSTVDENWDNCGSKDDDDFGSRANRTKRCEDDDTPPSPLQFMVTYETMQDNAAEDQYAQQTCLQKGIRGVGFAVFALLALYLFMVAIKLMGASVTLLLSCRTKDAFAFTDSPFAGLLIGTVTTALIHSSSTITSITVAVVGSGGMTIRQGVFVVMGANIGTCVTCMMVAFGYVQNRVRFERAMAAATVHDMYNVWSVLVLFPLEVVFRPLEKLSMALAHAHTTSGSFASPVDAVVEPLTELLLKVNKPLLTSVAAGNATCDSVQSFVQSGVFHDSTTLTDGAVGGIVLSIALLMLLGSLVTLVRTLAKVFLGPTKRVISSVLQYNGYVNIVVGVAITFVVHSSTVVTSTLTPMAGLGVITLEQVYPIMLGANLGTTANALLAALVTGSSNAVAMALTHLFFNVFGIVLFYPVPSTRRPILKWARSLAHYSASWPIAAVVFLLLGFVVVPAIGLCLVYMCTSDDHAVIAGGYVLVVLLVVHCLMLGVWYRRLGGRDTWHSLLERKRVEREIRKYGGNLGMPSFVDDDTSNAEYDIKEETTRGCVQ